ncbi:MAG: PAS domain S-box protein [Bacteroidetes bacterium]|nr:PAS domain S-box protein [Bacteroidota bacterium]
MKSINHITCENLLDSLPGMFYRCKNDKKWTMEWVSSGCKKLTGYSEEELINNCNISFNDLIHPEDRDWLWEKYSVSLKEMNVCNNEYRIICRLGRTRWVREVANGIYDDNGVLMSVEGYIQEFTCEKELTLLESAFNSYQEAVNSGSIVSITNTNGEIIYCNDLFLKVSQYSRSELIGQTHKVINSGFHSVDFFRELWETILKGNIWRGEMRNKSKDGAYYWVDTVISPVFNTQGEIVNFLSIRNLITDKKKKEFELIESEKFNREILSSFSSNIAVIDDNGLIISTNESWRKFSVDNDCPDLSRTCEGINYLEVCHNASVAGDKIAKEVLQRLRELINGESEAFQLEYPCHSQVTMRWFLLSATMLKGESRRVVLRHVDITERKLVEQKLADNEQKYRNIIENSQELILSVERNGNIVFANNVWQKVLGFSDMELIKMNFFDLLHVDVKDKCNLYFQNVLLGENLTSVGSQIISKNGSIVYVESNATPIRVDGEIVGVQLFMRDVTKKKMVEFELIRSENRFRKVFESVQDVIYTISKEGKFISLNPAFEKLSGYTIDEFVGRSFVELVHPDDLALAMATFYKIFSGEKVEKYNLRLKHKDNTYRICELTPGALIVDNIIVESLGLARDVTDRVLSEKKLRDSEERFNLALKGANDGLWDWNLIANEVYYSPRWKEMVGYGDHELENNFETWVSLLHPDDHANTIDKLNSYLSGKSEEYNVEFRLKHKNGSYIDVLARGFLIKDSDGNNVRITGTHLDMTELNLKKVQLQNLIDELSKKYNDLMQFNYIISHNLRTPVASILGLASLLKFPDNSQEDKDKILQNIVLSTEKIDEILKDLTNITSLREPLNIKRTQVKVKELIDAVIYLNEKRIEEVGAKIVVDVEEGCQTIMTIKPYFQSIVYNLMLNSLKYTSPDRLPKIFLNVKKTNQSICFQVSDNGIGIDMEKNRDKMFGLYQRFCTDVEGRGLGLFMTKMQVEALGGEIFVESTLNVGTTFTVHIYK